MTTATNLLVNQIIRFSILAKIKSAGAGISSGALIFGFAFVFGIVVHDVASIVSKPVRTAIAAMKDFLKSEESKPILAAGSIAFFLGMFAVVTTSSFRHLLPHPAIGDFAFLLEGILIASAYRQMYEFFKPAPPAPKPTTTKMTTNDDRKEKQTIDIAWDHGMVFLFISAVPVV